MRLESSAMMPSDAADDHPHAKATDIMLHFLVQMRHSFCFHILTSCLSDQSKPPITPTHEEGCRVQEIEHHVWPGAAVWILDSNIATRTLGELARRDIKWTRSSSSLHQPLLTDVEDITSPAESQVPSLFFQHAIHSCQGPRGSRHSSAYDDD